MTKWMLGLLVVLALVLVAWLEYKRFVECTRVHPYWYCGVVK